MDASLTLIQRYLRRLEQLVSSVGVALTIYAWWNSDSQMCGQPSTQ
jgi:hypothetical protein